MVLPGSRNRLLNARELQRRRRLLVLVASLVVALVLALGFFLGHRAAYSGMGIDPAMYRAMQRALPESDRNRTEAQAELEVVRTRHEVDRQALEMVRREIAAQKEQIADLEEGLRFYQSLMAPGEIAQGLSLRPVELVPREEARRYGFRIVAQQEARKHSLLKGELYGEVIGVRGEEQVSYPLSELSEDLEDAVTPLRFRYFQAIEGELILPEGFEPRTVSLVATATAPRKAEVREQFPWQLQERFTHVGK